MQQTILRTITYETMIQILQRNNHMYLKIEPSFILLLSTHCFLSS